MAATASVVASRVGWATISVCQRRPGATTIRQRNDPGNTLGSPEAVTERSCTRSILSRSMSSPSSTVISAPPSGVRPSLTENRSAKSVSAAVRGTPRRVRGRGCAAKRSLADRRPPASSRTTSSVLSANPARRPAQDELRRKGLRGLHLQWFGGLAVDAQLPPRQHPRAAEEQPLRAARHNIAPYRSDRQNVAPSTSVTVWLPNPMPAGSPLSSAGQPADDDDLVR